MNNLRFDSAQVAFEYWYARLSCEPLTRGTKCLYNQGFTLVHPLDNQIRTAWRRWRLSYAEREWQWYLAGDPSAVEISQHAPTWRQMMDRHGRVMSNYGWHWQRTDQLARLLELLKEDPTTRRASLSIFDAKEVKYNAPDVPCTYAVNFRVTDGQLHMAVMMRSNDLWYGFCNDQYCFSKLQDLVATELQLPVGEYFHFANNLHLYEKHLNLNRV